MQVPVPDSLTVTSKSEKLMFRVKLEGKYKYFNSIKLVGLQFAPHIFKGYFQFFLLKAKQKFVEILPTTYIFQSHSNLVPKVFVPLDKRSKNERL